MPRRRFGDDSEKRWRPQQRRTLCENPWFRVIEQQVSMPNGHDTTYYSLDFTGPAVGVVPRRKGEVLLVRQYRFLVDEFVWAIPSGGVGGDETPAAAALRELEEETGHRGASVTWLQSFYPSYGCGNQRFELFVAEGVTDSGRGFDQDEVLEARWFSESEIGRMLSDGDIVDGLSLAPLLLLCAREGWLR
jgi:8-oxo-dGTP pyrophosphatase MutT (NUDIX family)